MAKSTTIRPSTLKINQRQNQYDVKNESEQNIVMMHL